MDKSESSGGDEKKGYFGLYSIPGVIALSFPTYRKWDKNPPNCGNFLIFFASKTEIFGLLNEYK